MGTATYSINRYGERSRNLMGRYVNGGAHTTSTSASSLTTGAAGAGTAIQAQAGDVLRIKIDEDARLLFGGENPTSTSGTILFADQVIDLEISGDGEIRVIDVS